MRVGAMMDGGMSVEESKKSVGDSGSVISELWCLPGLNLSRIDAKSRIGFRFVGEANLEESKGEISKPFSHSAFSFSVMSHYPHSASIWTAPKHFWHIDGFEYGRWDSEWRVLHKHPKRLNRSKVWGSLWQSRFHQRRSLVPVDMLLWRPKRYPYWSQDGTEWKNNLPSIIESWEASWMIHLRKAAWTTVGCYRIVSVKIKVNKARTKWAQDILHESESIFARPMSNEGLSKPVSPWAKHEGVNSTRGYPTMLTVDPCNEWQERIWEMGLDRCLVSNDCTHFRSLKWVDTWNHTHKDHIAQRCVQ